MERLDLALEASNEGIWDWDFESGTIDFTERVGDFFGCPKEEVPNFFADHSFVHEDDRQHLAAAIQAVREGRSEILAVEPRVRTGVTEEGREQWKWFRVRGVPVKYEGQLTGLAGSLIDISLRKEAEQALLEEQHLTKTLVENVPLHIYFKDKKSRFTMVNTPMARWMHREKPEELLGKTDADFFGEEHSKQALADEQHILETGEAMESVIEKETWSGRGDTWVLTTKMPYRNRRGELMGTFGVSSDVTELVRTQRSLAEMAAELKARNEAYEEEMALAREIQQGLLPSEYPAVRSAKFGHRYLPISGLAGDFFDVIELGENKVGLLICDVMGHGIRSALVASLLRGLVSQARNQAETPGLFLGALNDGLVTFLKKAKVTMFATAFYLVVDFKKGRIEYSSAGHPAGIMSSEDGASLLPLGGRGKGAGLGLIPGTQYGEESIPLEGVTGLLLFTDGIYEVENSEGEAFLQNRLVQTVKRARRMPLEEQLDTILGEVKSFTEGGGFDDDVCLLGMSL
ncbi:SpoIIE family protein phosphatase [Roseibacillus ishigakijimensis]